MTEYINVREYINVQVFDDYLDNDFCETLLTNIIEDVNFPHPFLTKKGVLSKRRNKAIFGEIEHYTALYAEDEIYTKVRSWNELPILKQIADNLEEYTGQKYHVCVIQVYNSGDVGIEYHRDREMAPGTIIASVSLGCTRVMSFKRFDKIVDFQLKSGSLCLINPPTNDYWSHAIPKDDTNDIRISLIFRNCQNMIDSNI